MIKGRKKIIFAQESGTGYGFGFGEKDENQSIALYIRIGKGAVLMWSDSASNAINVMLEVNYENPASLDCLVEFMKKEEESQNTENDSRERRERK